MEEKKSKGISASAFFLIIAIIVIIAMGYFIYKLNKENKEKTEELQIAQKQVSNFNVIVSDLEAQIMSMEKISDESSEKNVENTNIPDMAEEIDIKIGTYNADEEKFDSAGVSYKDCGVTLANNNLCSVYEGFGTSHLGTYIIEGNKLICNTLINRGEEGDIIYSEDNIIFEFEIINAQQIKLMKIINNSSRELNSPGLVEEMVYSFSVDSQIKVLLDE